MSRIEIPLLLSLLASPLPALAGGGTLVGNGAGLVEQNVAYSYVALPRAIEACLAATSVCALSPDQAELLRRIERIAVENPASDQRIQFVSEKAQPDFFTTEAGQAQRIAKTGNLPTDVIYWNTDLFYLPDGSPALDLPALSALWVHELGHQAGEPSHEALDQIGAKVRLLLAMSALSLPYSDETSNVVLSAYGSSAPTARATVVLSDGVNITPLGSVLDSMVRCPGAGRLLGWSIRNLRWDSRLIRNLDDSSYLPLTAWTKVHCLEKGNVQDADVDLHLFLQFRTQKNKTTFWQALPSDGQGD